MLHKVCRHLKQWLVWGLYQQRSELRFKGFSDSPLLLVPSPLDIPPAWNAGMKCSLKLWLQGLVPPVVPSRRNLVSWISNLKAKVREKIKVALNNERKYQEIYFSHLLPSFMQIFSSLKTVFQSEFHAGLTALQSSLLYSHTKWEKLMCGSADFNSAVPACLGLLTARRLHICEGLGLSPWSIRWQNPALFWTGRTKAEVAAYS